MSLLESAGSGVIDGLGYVGELGIQLWSAMRAFPRVLPIVGKRGRWRAAIGQMAVIGVDALPMIAIMSVCTGFILAMQVGAELRRFGALQYVMDTVAIGFTRELGAMLTAIVVSGRSGSAFSAEIGTMVVTSEIDALRTMAIDPVEFVLAPKYVAALLVVPCLAVMSNAFGILAGAGFMYMSSRITLAMSLNYVADSIMLRDVLMGLLKSLVFAIIVVSVGCIEGFRTRGGPDAVGRSATSAVVKSTFLVILADAFFTAIYYMVRKD
jgi:phospholipid/cholesterol/gamma-HCH transport system permease protein